MKKALIIGITGQDGAYLAKFLIDKKYKVIGTSRSVEPNLEKLDYLGIKENIPVIQCDLLNADAVKQLIRDIAPDELYNLAGQSSVNYSYIAPAETISSNVLSVLNLLESVRVINPNIKFYQAATSEMYGLENAMPITEESLVHPLNPYGVSKAAGYLMVKNYRETYGLFCVSGVLFNHESHLRAPEFFIRKLIRTAIDISKGEDEYVYLGQSENRRDFGYSPNYVEAIWLMLQAEKPDDYVICSGHSVSIKEIAEYVLQKFNVSLDRIKIDPKLFRIPNIPDIYGDSTRAKNELGWKYDMSFFDVLDVLIEDELKACK